jgi:septal ring factor EnvC (AmiA/AmiB activator)
MFGDIIKGFMTGFMTDMKTTPHTSVSLLFVWGVLWGFYFFIWPDVVIARDQLNQTQQQQVQVAKTIEQLLKSVNKLDARIVKKDMEQALEDIELEIIDIERDISRFERAAQETPPALQSRLNALRGARARKERDINNFIREHPELAETNL